jgi:hypothetical protein
MNLEKLKDGLRAGNFKAMMEQVGSQPIAVVVKTPGQTDGGADASIVFSSTTPRIGEDILFEDGKTVRVVNVTYSVTALPSGPTVLLPVVVATPA